jgi:predicted membrane protein
MRADSFFVALLLWLVAVYTAVRSVMSVAAPRQHVKVLMATAVCMTAIHGSPRYGVRGKQQWGKIFRDHGPEPSGASKVKERMYFLDLIG